MGDTGSCSSFFQGSRYKRCHRDRVCLPFLSALATCLAERALCSGWQEPRPWGLWVGAQALPCEPGPWLLYFHAATRTQLPRSQPLLRGLCVPPTPVTRFSGGWWRAARLWRPSGSWRTGEPSREWMGAWFVCRLESTGPGQRWLASFPRQAMGWVRACEVLGPMAGVTGTQACVGVQLSLWREGQQPERGAPPLAGSHPSPTPCPRDGSFSATSSRHGLYSPCGVASLYLSWSKGPWRPSKICPSPKGTS